MKYPLIPQSHSSMDNFDKCPYAYEREKLIKDVPYTQTIAASWGDTVHDAFERFVKGEQVDLTTFMMQDFTPFVEYLRDFPCDYKNVETEFGINQFGQAVGFKDEGVILRGYIDYEAVRGTQGWVFDYKTGKRHSKFQQVELYALSMWMRFPQVDQIAAGYVWLKDRDPNTFMTLKQLSREKDMERIWTERWNQYQRIVAAHTTGVFPARPGKGRAAFPCGWCSVNRIGCDYANTEYCAK